MTTETTVQDLKINKLTKAQFNTITPSDTELYMVTDDVIASSDVITALGYTPYNATNPNGYQANVLETIKVNGTALIPTAKTVNINTPDIANLSYYGTCSTAATTQTKVVVCEGFTLKTGVSIRVKFTNAQIYNGMPLLNVNSTGDINVKFYGTVNAARYCWTAGEVVSFTYDGANWIMEDAGIATTSYYGYTKLYTGAVSTSTSTALTPVSLNNLVQLMVEPYPIYSGSATYEVGDRVRYGYQAWECITAITTAETWNADHWKEIDPIQTQIDNINAMIGDIETALNTINSGSNS